MKYLFIVLVFVIYTVFGSSICIAQQYSPYVESGTLIINNSGFESAALRTTPRQVPLPMHIHTDAENSTIPTRFRVARIDLVVSGNWAWANGLLLTANSVISGVLAVTVPTGCAAYAELDAIAGTWRMPTQREMFVVNLVRNELAAQNLLGFFPITTSRIYWTGTQYDATHAWVLGITAVEMSIHDKAIVNFIRCVKDL